MRELARREPTFALHVHVAVPDTEAAVRALRGLRVHVPLLLALSRWSDPGMLVALLAVVWTKTPLLFRNEIPALRRR